MSEKLLIINEKPTAAAAFKKALGGATGVFEGDEFSIVNLYGHIIGPDVPDQLAYPEYSSMIGKFSNIENMPWSPSWFDFNKKVPTSSSSMRIIRDIKGYLNNGYIPVIASDIDPSGEGDLLVREVLIYLGYTGKTYREYHVDETAPKIKEALRNKKIVDVNDPVYKMAFARSNMDYLSQQLTRVATMTIQHQGYKLPSPVPVGRLKSVILAIIGDQIKLLQAYKPSSVFESRYKLDNLILSGKDVLVFKDKHDWEVNGSNEYPKQSRVREVKQVPGHTIPPKAVTLSKLAGLMSAKGMKSKQFLDTYQKMYEAGIMSYPRTDDDFVSPEQFNEMLPLIDDILRLLGLPSDAFTHRQPRSTHVKTGGSHGAIRPGLTLPNSISELDDRFGPYSSDIYRIASERFLMMFLENTEWVRHEYETVDTETPFKGSIKVITKQGVVDPDENTDDVATSLPDLSKLADLYPHEVKSRKPHATTAQWVYDQLEKVNVGTGATRVSTVADMSGNKPSFPIVEKKALDLSTMGWIGYETAKGTNIGSVDGTIKITGLSEAVRDGKPFDEAYLEATEIIAKDIDIIKAKDLDLSKYNLEKAVPKVMAKGSWNGRDVEFNRAYMGHEFTDDEVSTLLSGGEVVLQVKDKNNKDVTVKGVLAEQEYKGHKFIGFKGEFMREGYVQGNWNGKDVTIKGSYMDHTFTPQELETLFSGGSVDIVTHKDDKTYELTGKLEEQEYQGRKFVGYKAIFPTREGYVKGVWNGATITFKGSYMDHTFTQDEIDKLLAGEEISIVTHKGDKTYNLTGKLEKQVYQGRNFIGFKGNFANTPREGYVQGVWNGKNVSFKGEFMKHKFSPDEIAKLLNGEKISIQGVSSKGNEMTVTGGLAEQTYQGRKFVGFKAEFDNKDDKGL